MKILSVEWIASDKGIVALGGIPASVTQLLTKEQGAEIEKHIIQVGELLASAFEKAIEGVK